MAVGCRPRTRARVHRHAAEQQQSSTTAPSTTAPSAAAAEIEQLRVAVERAYVERLAELEEQPRLAHVTSSTSRGTRTTSGRERLARLNEALHIIKSQPGMKNDKNQRNFHRNMTMAIIRKLFKDDYAEHLDYLREQFDVDKFKSEVLIITPRRFGKTFSVAMFVAAAAYALEGSDQAIFSTGRRASKKLLDLIYRFLCYLPGMKERVIQKNVETIHIQGPGGADDIRKISSYPSKVRSSSTGRACVVVVWLLGCRARPRAHAGTFVRACRCFTDHANNARRHGGHVAAVRARQERVVVGVELRRGARARAGVCARVLDRVSRESTAAGYGHGAGVHRRLLSPMSCRRRRCGDGACARRRMVDCVVRLLPARCRGAPRQHRGATISRSKNVVRGDVVVATIEGARVKRAHTSACSLRATSVSCLLFGIRCVYRRRRGAFTTYEMRMLVVALILVVLARGDDDNRPRCSWQCDDPVCEAVCEAVCAKPVCVSACSVDGGGDDVVVNASACAPPVCVVTCPNADDADARDECPQCETVCEPLVCDEEAQCAPLCEATRCEWACSAPTTATCAEPHCELVCESPACAAQPDLLASIVEAEARQSIPPHLAPYAYTRCRALPPHCGDANDAACSSTSPDVHCVELGCCAWTSIPYTSELP
jgi:hypothetical protein